MKNPKELAEQLARMQLYGWYSDEGYSDEQAGDAITTMNDLIRAAREITGIDPQIEGEMDGEIESPEDEDEYE
jgi:hypothetical protein